jgi:hypothetical protein
MKVRNIDAKYHWIAYLLYFSGGWFDTTFLTVNDGESLIREDSDLSLPEANERAIGLMEEYDASISDIKKVSEDIKKGHISVLLSKDYRYLGRQHDIHPQVLINASDPLNMPLEEIAGCSDTDILSVNDIVENFQQEYIDALGLEGTSIWNIGNTYSPSVNEFIHSKIQEGITSPKDDIAALVDIVNRT